MSYFPSPSSGLLHQLFSLPSTIFPQIFTRLGVSPSGTPVKHHFFGEALPDYPCSSAHPFQCVIRYCSIPNIPTSEITSFIYLFSMPSPTSLPLCGNSHENTNLALSILWHPAQSLAHRRHPLNSLWMNRWKMMPYPEILFYFSFVVFRVRRIKAFAYISVKLNFLSFSSPLPESSPKFSPFF